MELYTTKEAHPRHAVSVLGIIFIKKIIDSGKEVHIVQGLVGDRQVGHYRRVLLPINLVLTGVIEGYYLFILPIDSEGHDQLIRWQYSDDQAGLVSRQIIHPRPIGSGIIF